MRAWGRAFGGACALVLGLVSLGACTGDDDGSAGTTTSVAGEEPVDGGVVRLGLGEPVQADPALANLGSPVELAVLDLLHDGLTSLDADGQPEPALASEWTSDASLTTWTFALDRDATFSSGRTVTAADVIASLERVARGGDASLAALRLESIQGFRAFVDGSAANLAGLSAPDEATVQVVLDAPLSVLPVILAAPPFGVVDAASLEEVAADPAAIGEIDLSGAWSIADATADVVELVRRPERPGHLDGVELRIFDDGEAAYEAYDDGRLDWALVPVDRFGDAVEAHGQDRFAPFHAELFFGMRVTGPSLGNLELRKAVAAAIDREAIVRAVYPDLADPLSTIVPAGVPGHDAAACPDCGFDPDRARSLLAAAFPDGQVPGIAIDFDESIAQGAMARIVAGDLDAVGIPTTLRPKPLEEYKRFVVSGSQELFSFGWIGGYLSPDAYLAPLFASAADDNLTGYGSTGVDAALAAARGSADPTVAAAQWATVERQVLAEAVVVPIAQFRTQAVVADRVRELVHLADGSVDWSRVWVVDGT